MDKEIDKHIKFNYISVFLSIIYLLFVSWTRLYNIFNLQFVYVLKEASNNSFYPRSPRTPL